MGFVCPECSAPQGLRIRAKIELPPDSRSDEITLQVVECSTCGFAGIAVYEESRRGGLDSESFSHVGYRVSSDMVGELRGMIRQCPQPGNARCECAVHTALGICDRSQRWNGLLVLESSVQFGMRR